MKMKYRGLKGRGGFTLVEIMIVVAIIGLLAALVIPNAMRARERSCIEVIRSNLRIIEDSKGVWATENRAASGTVVDQLDLEPYLKGEVFPESVAGEVYNVNPVGERSSATLMQALVDLPVGTELTLEFEP
ncbi:MAG: competence type IV pilus major pilin ComGC [Limisphaerales bacterium]|jgi:prepilin-type N-terminal cleavage/methylation domain-containing protein